MRAVTSFSTEGYELYGREFLRSWADHWPGELYVYYEDEKPDFEHERIVYKNLFDVEGCMRFLQGCTAFPALQGIVNGKRNYRFDAFRFSRKSFAQIDAAVDYDGLLYWIDADTVTHDDPPPGFFQNALQDTFMCYLGRPEWHSCASLVGWDCSHEASKEFWAVYYNMHMTGQIFMLKEWHDSFVLDRIRIELELPAKNLSVDVEGLEGPANVFNHTIPWATHKKGNLKFREAASN